MARAYDDGEPPKHRTRVLNAERRLAAHMRIRARIFMKRWRRRTVFVVGGLLVGAAAIAMAKLADYVQIEFKHLLAFWPQAAWVVTPGGFALAAYLAGTVFANSQGSGIPQVIAARHMKDEKARARLVSLRVGLGKILLLLLGLACGASTGREGPTVQVGAAIMFAIGTVAPFRQRGFLLAGGAAGVAAAFNTPLAGIVFGIEEMSRSFEAKTTGLVVGAVIAAGLTSLAVVGDYTYFGSTAAVLPLGRAWLVVPVCAVIGGLLGGVFSRLLIVFSRYIPVTGFRWILKRPVLFAAVCGLGVAICGTVTHGSVYGTGYDQARAILHGHDDTGFAFALWKFGATVFSAISGIPGGIFAPSLAIGAGIGKDLTMVFHSVPLGALALLGMVSYLSGVVQAPITSFVIVSEMTEDHAMILPLMIAAVIANAASKIVCRDGVYHALSHNFLHKEADETRREKEAAAQQPHAA